MNIQNLQLKTKNKMNLKKIKHSNNNKKKELCPIKKLIKIIKQLLVLAKMIVN